MIPRKERCAAVAFTTLFAGCGLWGDPSQMMQPPDAGQPNMAGPCSSGRITAGNVLYSGTALPNAAGQGLFDDPPVSMRRLAFSGSVLHTNTLSELWSTDLSQLTPPIARYAGVDRSTEGNITKYQDGPCTSARFSEISGIAVAPDGSLFVTDKLANSVLRVTSPGSPGCSVSFYAGTSTASASVPPIGLSPGDQDGAGASARFRAPTHPVVDGAGNLFLIDNVRRLRKVANDAAHTVSTVANLPGSTGENYSGMTLLGGRLYATFIAFTSNSIVEIDPSSGAARTLFQGKNSDWPELDPSTIPALADITHDGTDLYVTGHSHVWSLSVSGAIRYAAGSAEVFFPPNYSLTAAHPVTELVLPANVANAGLALRQGSLYFRGNSGTHNNAYIIEIKCP